MELTTSHIQFIKEHATDDLTRLLLSAAKYPGMDIPFLVDQIAVRRQIREKLPSWFENGQLVFPAKIAAEQCSSEQTAAYKQELIGESWTICDLTGGLGIDSYFLSRKAKHLTYIERFPVYCEAAKHNFSVLEANNITIINADAAQVVDTLPEVDAFYIDPARRGESNKRVFALQDCEPNLPGLLPALLKRSPRVIAKLSPMADIQMTLELLPGTTSVHVLSVRNECKELLLVLDGKAAGATSDAAAADTRAPHVYCVNDDQRLDYDAAAYTRGLRIGDAPLPHELRYLYEPNASIMKAGCFDVVEARFGAVQIGPSSHLFVSDEPVDGFPGRGFAIETIGGMGKKELKRLLSGLDRANIAVRNFPLTAPQLRKKLKLADGGDAYLFGTTMQGGDHVLIRTAKISR